MKMNQSNTICVSESAIMMDKYKFYCYYYKISCYNKNTHKFYVNIKWTDMLERFKAVQ